MERVEMNITGPLPVTNKGNKYILSSMIVSPSGQKRMPNQEAETIVTVFVNDFISRFGTPLQIHSAEHSNGYIKRFNRTLTAMLMLIYCEKEQNLGDEFLPQVLIAYSSSKQSCTRFSPTMMVLGRNITMPLEADVADYISNLQTADHGGSQDPYPGLS